MKIIQVIPRFGFGGAEIMCENLSVGLKKLGHDVIVVSLFNERTPISERLESCNIDVRYLHKKKGLDLNTILNLRKIIKDENPDIIHSHIYALKYCVLSDLFLHHKKVHTVHSIASKESTPIDQKGNKLFFSINKVVPVALSRLVQETVSDCYGISNDKIPVIYNGCPIEKCSEKKTYSLAKSISIVHTGSLIKLKNHRSLIDALVLLHTNYPNIKGTFIGDGVLRQELQEYIQEKGADSYIQLYGLTTDVYSLLKQADIFVLPSIYEGMPMSIIEAMGTGLPIIASNVGGIPDMIQDGFNGLLCKPEVQSIYSCLLSMIKDDGLREKCGLNARKSVELFTAERMSDNYVNLYIKVKDGEY